MLPRIAALAASLALIAGCSSGTVAVDPSDGASNPRLLDDNGETVTGPAADRKGKGLIWSVSDDSGPAPRLARPPVAEAKPLDPTATDELLSRLPDVGAQAGDVKSFALREGVKPPPRAGETVEGAFPPPAAHAAAPSAQGTPPKVLRYQPTGAVPMAPRVSVTFSNPMVAVTSHDELAKGAVPATITPAIEGHWRWVGTKTLFFEPDGRAPMATDYTVEVPAGVKDALGQPLPEGATWSFSTPPPSLKSRRPTGDAVDLEPTFVAVFDQRVDPEAILGALKVTAGKRDVAIRPLTDKETKALPEPGNKDIAGRWVAFKAKEKLPKATSVTVTLPAGAPSAEGPRKTVSAQSWGFDTYGPFRVVEAECGWRDCRPMTPWTVELSNPIDEDRFDPKMIEVTPKVEGFKAEVWGRTMNLMGMTRGRTVYTVKLSPKMVDVYGQELGEGEPLQFQVGPADKAMGASDQGLVVLDPTSQGRRYSVWTINYDEVDVALYKVTPKDFDAFLKFQSEHKLGEGLKVPPGHKVFSQRLATKGAPDQMTELSIDLAPALNGDVGQVIVLAKPVGAKDIWAERRGTVLAWVQATHIGLDAFVDHGELVGWATSLADGEPLADLALTLEPQGLTAKTGPGGLATIQPLPKQAETRQRLVARKGEDVAFLPENKHYWSNRGRWVARAQHDQVRWMTFDDRKMYRPGETVSIKGWLRLVTAGDRGDVASLPAGQLTKVSYVVHGSRGNELGKGEAEVNRFGGFDLAFEIPKTPNLGQASVRFDTGVSLAGASHTHRFDIQEFRRPEFEVNASVSPGPHLVGGHASMSLQASYFSGGPLPNAETRWSLQATPGSYTPPNQGDFIFGVWVPWWRARGQDAQTSYRDLEGLTDRSGKHAIRLDFEAVDPPRAMSVTGEGTVVDVNRQAWTATASLLVHPANHYVGLRTERRFVQPNEPITVEAIVANIDGQRLVGSKIAVELVRLAWTPTKRGDWTQVETDSQTCELTSAKEAVACKLTPNKGGTYRVRARITDNKRRVNETTMIVWVAGGDRPPSKKLEQEQVELIPSRRDYQPGETAEILVQAPFSPAQGVMSVRRDGLVETVPFSMSGPSHTLRIPVEEWMIPGFEVVVNLSGSAPRAGADGAVDPKLPRRPAFARGSLTLRVPPKLRTFDVAVTPAASDVEPGASTSLTVKVTDHAGAPVEGVEVAVVAVDEAILALTGYRIPNPVDVFYTTRGGGVSERHLRDSLLLASLDELFDQPIVEQFKAGGAELDDVRSSKMAPMAASGYMKAGRDKAGGDGGGGDSPIAVRKDFNPLALFAPEVRTGADGAASVDLELPDSLTRYRLMAVAVDGDHSFGSGESTLTARLPLMVRMSPPRFLNFGDRFELPVVVQNQTDGALEVRVAVKATNATLTEGAGRTVTVPANDRVEVRFPAAAAKPGTARLQAGAAAGAWTDAAEVSLPVWTPATTEAFATYGEIDADGAIAQPVKTPGQVVPQFGGLDVTTSSTQLQALTDAVLYLTSYPFECAEQVASRVMSVAALKDVLTAFEADGLPSPQAMIASVAQDVKRLAGMQNDDGGFGFWRRGRPSWPFLSAHVGHALARARAKGFEVPEQMWSRIASYLDRVERYIPKWYSAQSRRAIRAYAAYVRLKMGTNQAAKALAIIKEAGGVASMGLETLGWIYPVLSESQQHERTVKQIRQRLNNAVAEQAGTAHFVTSYSDGAHVLLHSRRRVDGLLLEGLIGDQPRSDLIPKLVRGLLAHRTKGRWANTQESAWVLLGLDRYFNTFEKVTPAFVARVWLGDGYAGGHKFAGRTTERHHIGVPMAWLVERGGADDLIISKRGPGRLYYRLGMRYAPASLEVEPADHGFTVERVYEAMDDPQDVTRDAEGRWVVRAGARVKVKVTMVSPERRYHVALVDPLPAGFEAENPALKGTASLPQTGDAGPRSRRWWWGPWYDHTNLRDERAEAFSNLLWSGVYTYTYFARATTPGEFVVPPPKVEEMYHPETFGRGASARVIVR